ncbi:MAG: hypothetical protein CMK32_09330 [Porticoccaceae bacterium]|nr:hypothetical protein [Porticoccaceae bacterium]
METNARQQRSDVSPVRDDQKNLVLLVYILQTLSFVIGVTSIAGVIVNYLKRDAVRGTWLESHFRWQIKTFWYILLGYGIGLILLVVLIGWLVMLATTIWYIYRIIKGWLAYSDGRELPDAFF